MANKTKIELKEATCPFCNHTEILQTSMEKLDKEGNAIGTYGIDSWECPECGAEHDIDLEIFEREYTVFKKFTEKDDFEGLLNFCKNNDFDDFMLYSFGKYYIQKKEFKKEREIGKVLVSIDNKDIVAKDDLIDTPLERLKSIKNSKK